MSRGLSLLNNHYPSLHGLRAVMVVVVLQVHVTFVALYSGIPVPDGWRRWSFSVWYSMDLFFVLSGFLIGYMLLYSIEDRSEPRMLRFYIRRAFRILPLYYVCLVLIALLPRRLPTQGIDWREWVYLTNFPFDLHDVMYWSWSLSVEEHFYLLVPLLMVALYRLSTHARRLWLLACLWLACLVIKLPIALDMPAHVNSLGFLKDVYTPTYNRIDTMVAGIAAAYIHRTWPRELDGIFSRRWVNVLLPLAVVIPVIIMAAQFSVFPGTAPGRPYFLKGALMMGTPTSILFAALLLWVIHARNFLTRILSHRFFRYYATLSYGIYIVHIPVIEHLVSPNVVAPLDKATGSFAAAWCAGLAACFLLSLAVAYTLHQLVEKPALRLRDRLAS